MNTNNLEYIKKKSGCIVYIHRHPITKKAFYVGMGVSEKRAKDKRSRSEDWKKFTDLNGFEYEIVKKDVSWEEAGELESLIIKTYGRKDLGNGSLLNKTNGGMGCSGIIAWNKGVSPSEKTKQKLREANLGKKASEETRLKISASQKGTKKKPCSEQKKQTLREIYSKKVIDTVTGEVFESAKVLALLKNIEYTSLCKKLCGSRKNKTNYKYL